MFLQAKIYTGRQWKNTKNFETCREYQLPYVAEISRKVIWHHYKGMHQLKRGTAACERNGPIHKAKIRLGSSLQPELFKQ